MFSQVNLSRAACGLAALLGLSVAALGQSDQRAVFVANNGNLEGSVTSFLVNADGTLTFVQKLLTPQTNCWPIALSPDGRLLGVGHATIANDFEQFDIIRVNSDATMTILQTFLVPDADPRTEWLSNDTIAIVWSPAGTDYIIVYRFDEQNLTLTQIDAEPTGTFTGYIALSHDRRFLYAADSGVNDLFVYSINGAGTLDLVEVQSAPSLPLGVTTSAQDDLVFTGRGISGNLIDGYTVNGDGSLEPMAMSPFVTLGSSPFALATSADDELLFVGHGSDGTVRSLLLDKQAGTLTPSFFSYDLGLQGSVGMIQVLDEVLLVTDKFSAGDGVTGIYSFKYVSATGEFSLNAPLYSTQGVSPERMAIWKPPVACPGDYDASGAVDLADLGVLLGCWGTPCGDLDGNQTTDLADLGILLGNWGSCP